MLASLALAGCADSNGCTADCDQEDPESSLPPNPDPPADNEEPQPVQHELDIESFTLPDLTVKVGDTIIWTNQDSARHTATSDDGSTFDTGALNQGDSASWTATAAGSFPYHCTFHPSMQATITVTE